MESIEWLLMLTADRICQLVLRSRSQLGERSENLRDTEELRLRPRSSSENLTKED
jgi:hypothetical protein